MTAADWILYAVVSIVLIVMILALWFYDGDSNARR